MKTSLKVAFVLIAVIMFLTCIDHFASGNFSAGMAYIIVILWIGIAHIHYDRAEHYRKAFLELLAKQYGLVLKEDDKAHRTVRFNRKKEDDHGKE